MRIGYSVEGVTDQALIKGLARRWCPKAEVVQGGFRGSTHTKRRAEISKICSELSAKGVDVIVFLSDCNNEDWRSVLKQELDQVPEQYQHIVIVGICDRNVECWFCADVDWLAKQLGKNAEFFRVEDPKSIFEEALGITPRDRKESEIMDLVHEAQLKNWLHNRSFEDFYDKAWAKSKQLGCGMENVREG